MSKDPVCHTDINEKTAHQRKLVSDFDGETYYFCSNACKKAFDAKPREYTAQVRWPEDWRSQETDQPYGT